MDELNILGPGSEGNWWTRRTAKHKAFIVVGLVALVTAIVLISVFVSAKKKAPSNVDVCLTDACKEIAKIISENLDLNADPCDDFYLYACGRFKDHHPLPVSGIVRATDSVVSVASRHIYEVTKELTQKSFDNEEDSKAIKYAKTMLDLCIDTDKMEKTGLTPLKELVKDLGDWKQTSILESTESTVAGSYLDKMAKIMGETGVGFIVGLVVPQRFVIPNLNEPDRYTLLIAPQENIIPSLNEDHLKALKDTIITAADLMQAPNIKKNVDKIIKLVVDLLKIGTKPGEIHSLTDPFKVAQLEYPPLSRMTVGELIKKAPGINWLHFFNKVLKAAGVKEQLTLTDMVIVDEINKIKMLKDTLDKHDDEIIEDYMGFLLLKMFGFLTTAKFRENLSHLEKIITGHENALNHKECVRLIAYKSNLDFLIARLYVDKYFDDDDKEEIEQLVINLRDTFKSFLPSHQWLDEKTRDAATEKIDKIRINTGFPQFIKDNRQLDKMYPFPSLDNPNAVTQYQGLVSGLLKEIFGKLNQEIDLEKEWPMKPVMPVFNAGYQPGQNSITFPASSLLGIVFNSERPSSINYGALGLVAGHEITHGFDTQGANYTADGRYRNWWSDYSRKQFNEKAKCFEEQYSAIKDQQTGIQLNGAKTVGENIADNGGIHQAFAAYKKVAETKKEALLPGLIQFSHDQLFFLSHANVWCVNASNEVIKYLIEGDEHSLNRYRVTVPLMNSPDFAKAFNCPKGSKMNPENKCSLW